METITHQFSPGEAAVLAIAAGVDVLLVGHCVKTQDETYKAVIEAVRNGRISIDRISESYARISKAKKQLKQNQDIERKFGEELYSSINKKIVKHALDVVEEGASLPILIAEAKGGEKAFNSKNVVQNLESAGFLVEVHEFPAAYTEEDKYKLISMAKSRPLVIFLGWKTYEDENQIHLVEEITKVSQNIFAIDTSRRV